MLWFIIAVSLHMTLINLTIWFIYFMFYLLKIFECPFADHHAPPLAKLLSIVQNIDKWIQSDPHHVAAVHCKVNFFSFFLFHYRVEKVEQVLL